jgi:hypothetical protein
LGSITESDSGVYQCVFTDDHRGGEVLAAQPIRLDHGEIRLGRAIPCSLAVLPCLLAKTVFQKRYLVAKSFFFDSNNNYSE